MTAIGAAAGAIGSCAVQWFTGGTITPWTVAGWAGAGFAVSSVSVLLYDWAYEKGIWKEFEAKHPKQAVVFSAINILLLSWGMAVAAKEIPDTPDTAQKLLEHIKALKEEILALPKSEAYAKEILNALDNLNEKSIVAFLTNAKKLAGNPKRNAMLLSSIAIKLNIVKVNDIVDVATDVITAIRNIDLLLEENNAPQSTPVATPAPA